MPRKKAIDEPIPLQIVKQMSDAFPGCYDEVEKMRRDKGKELPDWDDRCYIPINATLAIMDLYRGKNPNFYRFPALLAAIAAWRRFKPIYTFDKDLFDLLTSETDDIIIPMDVLQNLPYDCLYIDVEEAGKEYLGYFVCWDYDVNTCGLELRFLEVSRDGEFVPDIMMVKSGWTIEDSVKALIKSNLNNLTDTEIVQNMKSWGIETNEDKVKKMCGAGFVEHTTKRILELLQPVLYICAINADISENPEQKKIHRPPAPKAPIKDAFREIEKWDVGVRVGSQIRKHRVSEDSAQSRSSGTHRSPRPHTRRAHWAHYWTGPRKPDEDGNKPEQTLILKWIPPTYVNFGGDDGELPAVEHKVK